MTRAAVSIIQHGDKFLCVWNKRYNGWSFPGGKVEEGETPEEAQDRELREETGLTTFMRQKIFEGAHGIVVESSRGSHVVLFRVWPFPGEPKQVEEGCPVKWLTREEFLSSSPFSNFYREKVFPALDATPAPRSTS